MENTEILENEELAELTELTDTEEPQEAEDRFENASTLYIVATPIGNSKDMSGRADTILSSVDLIAAEDTRRTVVLLNKRNIKNRLISNHKFNEHKKVEYLIGLLKEGKSIAVVSDAGTPCISDPGNELIKAAIEEGIRVVGVPGCCALTTALSVSGFDLRTFEFIGFLPRENNDKIKLIEKLRRNLTAKTFVFYESPQRIEDTTAFFIENHIDCTMCVCNDLSKKFEKIFRGTPCEIAEQLREKFHGDPKGEYAVVFEFNEDYRLLEKEHAVSAEAVLVDVMKANGCSVKEAIKIIMKTDGNDYSRNELYDAGLWLKETFG